MKIEEAIWIATTKHRVPTAHEQAGASYVLAKEVERLQAEIAARAVAESARQIIEYGVILPTWPQETLVVKVLGENRLQVFAVTEEMADKVQAAEAVEGDS